MDIQKSDNTNELLADNNRLRDCLADLVDMYRDFLDGDRNYEEAYHCFYKGHYKTWGEAEELLGFKKHNKMN